MTTELTFLTLTALLAASLWIPYIIGVNATNPAYPKENRPLDQNGMVPWVHRSYRAHLNLLEQFLPFAVIVLVLHTAGVSTGMTVWTTGAFFFLRIAHAVWMIGGFPVLPIRPILFSAGWVCILLLVWQALAA